MPATSPAVAIRWTGALTIVLALHGAAAWLLLTRTVAPISLAAAPEAVMLDLAPDLPAIQPAAIVPPAPPAPPPLPTPLAPPPPPPIATPEPPPPTPEPLPSPDLPPPDLPPTPPVAAEVELPVPPPPPPPRPQPKPKPKPTPPQRRVERQPTPPVAEAVERPIQPIAPAPPTQAAPQASSRPPAPASTIPTSWRSDLLGRLQRAKRYPDLARSRGDQGVATVSFTMDRTGHVLAVTLIRSSGSSLLDEEAAALVRRAEPLPRLPDEIAGTSLTLTVPISFALR